MSVAIDTSGKVHLEEEAQEIYDDIEESNLTYGDLEDEYGEKFAVMALTGPDAVVKDEKEKIYLGEISIAGASSMSKEYEEHLTPDKKKAAATITGGAATIATAAQFLKTGEPGWLASSLMAANLTKNPAKTLYREIEAYKNFQEDIQSEINEIKEEFDELTQYDIHISEEDMANQILESMAPQEAMGIDMPTPEDLDTGAGFQ